MNRKLVVLAVLGLLAVSSPLHVSAQEDGEAVEETAPVAAVDETCRADLKTSSQEVSDLKARVATLSTQAKAAQETAQASETQLKAQISKLEGEIASLKQSVKKAEAERDGIAQELKQTSDALSALRLEQESSPVPASVVLLFARLNPLLSQAHAFWETKVQPHVTVALRHVSAHTAEARAWAAAHLHPAAARALAQARSAAGSLHERLAKHETLGAHYTVAQRHAGAAAEKAQALYAQASVHAALAVEELETLLTVQLKRFPSTAPLAIKPYPAVIVKGLLWLPLVALVLSLLGGRKGKRSPGLSLDGTPRSAKKPRSKRH